MTEYTEFICAPALRYPWYTRWLAMAFGVLFLRFPPLAGTAFHRWLNRRVLLPEISFDGGETWRRV